MSFVSDKVALITGGASGIGLCYAKELLRNGLKGVTLADIDTVKGEEAVESITKEFGPSRVIFVKTDVSSKEDIEAAFEKTIEAFKNLDIVINNAGIMNDAVWEKEIQINLIGPIVISLLAIEKYLPKYRSGSEAIIINISSILGLVGHGALPIYSATKHAIIGLSKSFGVKEHYDRTKIRILTICPGVTDTPLITASSRKNLGDPYEDILQHDMGIVKWQTPESVAKGMIKVIDEGETGSFWIIDGSETTKVILPDVDVLLGTST